MSRFSESVRNKFTDERIELIPDYAGLYRLIAVSAVGLVQRYTRYPLMERFGVPEPGSLADWYIWNSGNIMNGYGVTHVADGFLQLVKLKPSVRKMVASATGFGVNAVVELMPTGFGTPDLKDLTGALLGIAAFHALPFVQQKGTHMYNKIRHGKY